MKTHFLHPDNFAAAWDKVASNHGCAGVDGETIHAFAQGYHRQIAHLRDAVARGTYRPLPWRQIWIPKKSGGWRELRVPTVRDRIVQQAMLNVLHPRFEAEFAPQSFAYRPGRSHLMAVRQVGQWRDQGYDWVLDADIVQYFENLAHPRLLSEVQEVLDLPWLLHLIEQWLTVGVLTPQGLLLPTRGVPQGAVISPLLANVYLDDFDDLVTGAGLKLVRYADDFVVLARTRARILEAQGLVSRWLGELGLQLHPGKTQVTDFERGFRFLGHAFAGEVIVPLRRGNPPVVAPNPAGVEGQSPLQNAGMALRLVHADIETAHPTEMQLALVEALKAEAKPIPPPLFVVLGYAVREPKSVPIESKEVVWSPGMAVLYLVEQGTTIRRSQGRFIVLPPKEARIEILIQEVEAILIFGGIEITTAVMEVCFSNCIPVVFLTQMGEYKGHLWSEEAYGFGARLAQFERRQVAGFALEVSRALVWGKLMNSKQFLLRRNRKRRLESVQAAIEGISRDLAAVETVQDLDQLRGYEGAAAARYFGAFGQLITHKDLTFEGRNRRPPTDPVNSLLSFGYTLLYENVLSLILAEGLSPYMGNFHYGERPKPYLAFDLVEEFRAPVVDNMVLTLVNKSIVRPTDFTWPNEEGGVYLDKRGRRIFLKHFELAMSAATSHPDVQTQVSYRRAIHLQVKRYKRAVRDNVPYEAFIRTI